MSDLNPRFRLIFISLFLTALLLGQGVSVLYRTERLWPFTQLSVYREFPKELRQTTTSFTLLTPDGEIDLARAGRVNFRIIRHFRTGLMRAKTEQQRELVMSQILDYATGKAPGEKLLGLKLVEETWNLQTETIIDEKLRYQYMKHD